MKPPVTGIVVLSLAAGLFHAAGPPPRAGDFRLTISGMTTSLIPAAPTAAAGSGLAMALATLRTALEQP